MLLINLLQKFLIIIVVNTAEQNQLDPSEFLIYRVLVFIAFEIVEVNNIKWR